MRNIKSQPYSWSQKSATRFIRENAKQLKETLAIYSVLTELASDLNSDCFNVYGIKIQEMSGVGRDSFLQIINFLHDNGLIKLKKGKLTKTHKFVYGELEIELLNFENGKKHGIQCKTQCKKPCKKSASIEEIYRNNLIEENISIEGNFSENNNQSNLKTFKEEKEKSSAKKEKEEKFEIFYSKYPKKVDRKKALLAFQKLTNSEIDKALNALENHINFWHKKYGEEKTYIPNPTTWINGAKREDEIDLNFKNTNEKPRPANNLTNSGSINRLQGIEKYIKQ